MQTKKLFLSFSRGTKNAFLMLSLFLFTAFSAMAQCDWTIDVISVSSPGDEIIWQLKDADGNILLEGLPDEAMGTFTTTAEGPLSFHISTYGDWGDNDAQYSVSNGFEIVAQGHIQGGEEATHENLNCATFEPCDEVTAGTVEDLWVCASTPITLTATGATQNLQGLTYQWQRSTDMENWVNINQATTVTYIYNVGITQETYFRMTVTCENGNTDTTDVITANLKPTLECYCMPIFLNGCTPNQHIDNVTLIGESQNIDNDSECSENAYGDYTDLTPADLIAGGTYNISVSTNYAFPMSYNYKAWIDYDNSGSFEEDEIIADTNMSGMPNGVVDFDFELPEDLEPGAYRLRVRMVYGSFAMFDACNTETYGETEDYMIEVVALDDCSEPISAGTIEEDEIDICPNSPFIIQVDNAPYPANGLTRTWQQSPAGQNEWADMEGENHYILNLVDGIDQETDFRFAVTCNEGTTEYSNIVEVRLNDFEECYCMPEYPNSDSTTQITNVKTQGGITNLNNASGYSSTGYEDFTDFDPLRVSPGQEIDMEITFKFFSNRVTAWVDWNQDGIFSEDEIIVDSGYYIASPYSESFFVPEDIELNTSTRMRVKIEATGAELDPCTLQVDAEIEDYTIEIIEQPTCLAPSEIEVNGITNDSAHITWEENENHTGWLFVYGETGFDWENTDPMLISETPEVFLNDLQTETEYEFYIRSICGEDESFQAGPVYFTTTCNATDVPYYEDFDDAVVSNIPNCTSLETNAGNPWQTQEGNFVGYSGNVLYYQYHITDQADSWFFTRGINLEEGVNYHFSYTYGNNSTSFIEKLRVAMGTSPSSNGMTTEIADHTFSINDSETNHLFFNVEESGVYYFGFQAHSDANQITLFLDDIFVIFGPDCPTPTNIDFEFVSDNSARVTWNPGANADQWRVVYGEPGFLPGLNEEGSVIVDEPYADLSNLEEGTDYDVYVQSICGEDWGELSEVATFTTLSDVPENARLCDAIMIEANLTCSHSMFNNYNSFSEIDEPTGSCHNNFVGYTSVWFSFVAPANGEATISATSQSEFMLIQMTAFASPEDCEDLSTLVEVGCANVGSDLELTDLVPGEVYYIRIAGFNNAEGEFCIQIETDIDSNDCTDPSDISVSEVEYTTANVSWIANGTESQWEVAYGEAGFDLDSEGTKVVVDTPSITLTDLADDTEYDVYVRAICDTNQTSNWVGPENFTTKDLSVDNQVFQSFSLYPNPVENELTLKAGNQIQKIEIFNLLGQSVMTLAPETMETQVNTEALQSGTYLMKVSINGVSKTFRIIKK